MKRANGTGTIYKIKRPLRKPYQIKLTVNGKRIVMGYASTLKEAEKMLSEYISKPYDIEFRNITIDEIWQKLDIDVSQDRINSLNSAYNHFKPIWDVPIRDLRTTHFQEIFDSLEGGESVRRNMKSILKRIYAYAMMNDICDKDYSAFIKIKSEGTKVQRIVFTSEEINLLWQRADEWEYAFTLILLYSGLRIKELTDLRNEDVENGWIHIREGKNRNAVRDVPIHKRIEPLLVDFKQRCGEYAIVKPNGYKIEYRNFLGREWKGILAYLGTEHLPYDVRHTFITRMRECGADLLVLQRIVGHQPDTITHQVYTHISEKEKENEISKLEY